MVNICLSTLQRCLLWIASYDVDSMLEEHEQNAWLEGLKKLIASWSPEQIEQTKEILGVTKHTSK